MTSLTRTRWLLTGAALLAHGLSATLPRRPHWVNLPDKPLFLALPPTRQAPVIARMQALFAAVTLQMTLIMSWVTWMTWLGATGRPTGNATLVLLLIALLSTPLLLGVFLTRIQGELARQIAATRNEPPGGTAPVRR